MHVRYIYPTLKKLDIHKKVHVYNIVEEMTKIIIAHCCSYSLVAIIYCHTNIVCIMGWKDAITIIRCYILSIQNGSGLTCFKFLGT